MINAAGIWGQQICEYAPSLGIRMFPGHGLLLIMDTASTSWCSTALPQAGGCGHSEFAGRHHPLIGTTPSRIDYHQDFDRLTRRAQRGGGAAARGDKLPPSWRAPRLLRAYAGVMPLVAVDGDESGRKHQPAASSCWIMRSATVFRVPTLSPAAS